MSIINKLLNVAPTLVTFWIISGIALLISGIICLCIPSTSTICTIVTNFEYEIFEKRDITDCKNDNGVVCHKAIELYNDPCKCEGEDEPIKAINTTESEDIVVLYQLDTFNKSSVATQPNYLKSRDDRQLSGILIDQPSETCDPYRYDNNVSIAPCGAIADAMYNDTIYMYRVTEVDLEMVPMIYTGLLTESQKKGYRNPPLRSSQDLRSVFQNFSKPINWQKKIWELDTSNPDNNGFQNEGFIAWMNTDLQLKPMWRLNKTGSYKNGLPEGEYRLGVDYNYPRARYDGPRTMILARRHSVHQQSCEETINDTTELYYIGSSAVGIALLFLLLAAAYTLLVKFYVPDKGNSMVQSNKLANPATPPPSEPAQQNLITDKKPEVVQPITDEPQSPAKLDDVEPQQKLLKTEKKQAEHMDNDYL